MSQNTKPIYTQTPNLGGIGTAVTTAANTAFDGTGTVITSFTAGANGSYVQSITFNPQGGGSNNNIQSVARIFANNGSTNGTATNNLFIGEITLPATTGAANSALPPIVFPLNFPRQAGYKINWCLGTAVATGYWAHTIAGDY
jgi:hypothetical protein